MSDRLLPAHKCYPLSFDEMTPEEIQKAIEGLIKAHEQAKSREDAAFKRHIDFERRQLTLEERLFEADRRQSRIETDIEKMLSVQKDLQEAQMQLTDALHKLIERSHTHDERIQQLIDYSLSSESDRLDLA